MFNRKYSFIFQDRRALLEVTKRHIFFINCFQISPEAIYEIGIDNVLFQTMDFHVNIERFIELK